MSTCPQRPPIQAKTHNSDSKQEAFQQFFLGGYPPNMDIKNTPVNTTALTVKIRKVSKPTKTPEPKTPTPTKTSMPEQLTVDDMNGMDSDEEEEIIIDQGVIGQHVKIPKKVPKVQETEQFAIYRLLKKRNVSDDEIVDELGIRASVQEQIQNRLDLLASDDFAHFKNWKKLKLKPPKVVKAATSKVAKRTKFVLADYDKKRIPDAEHGLLYYIAKNTLPQQPGPQVYRDSFERTFVGHWVDGMIEPV